MAMQELIWRIKPELIIETGVAQGGSLLFYASILTLIGQNGKVIGIDICDHSFTEIQNHPMSARIILLKGSSTDKKTVKKVYQLANNKKPILVVLDSNHTYEHVLKELEFYSPLVTAQSYLIIFDTIIEDLPDYFFPNRPWGKGNNPKTAVLEFLKKNTRFEIDKDIESKLLFTTASDGYLRCVNEN